MPLDSGPHDIDTTRLILGPDAHATLKPVTPTFYQELDAEFGSFAGHLVIAQTNSPTPGRPGKSTPRATSSSS